jgi:hypothetical protein
MKKLLLAAAALFVAIGFCTAKEKQRSKQSSNTFGHDDSVYFATTHYRLAGPFRGGRSGIVAGS